MLLAVLMVALLGTVSGCVSDRDEPASAPATPVPVTPEMDPEPEVGRFDLLVHGGPILTMSEGAAEVEALAVDDGRVVAAGPRQRLLATLGRPRRTLDLAGRTLLPGLIEPHTHPVLSAILADWVDVSGLTHDRPDAVWGSLERAVAAAEPGAWVYAFGFDGILVQGLEEPTLAQLDALAPDNPLFVLQQSMHTAWVNSAAVEAATVPWDAPDPGNGGRFGRDEAGRLDGRLEEAAAMTPFLAVAMGRAAAQLPERLDEQFVRYAERGITTIGATGLFLADPAQAAIVARAADAGTAPLRVVAYLYPHQLERVSADPAVASARRFSIAGVKVWYDGSPYTGTMLMAEPYLASFLAEEVLGIEPGTSGHANHADGALVDLLQPFHDAGLSIAIHAQGDRAVEGSLDVFEALERSGPGPAGSLQRHRIEHGLLFPLRALSRAAELGVSPSFHINHIYYYGDALEQGLVGPERMADALPLRSAYLAGLHPSLHADSPMYPPRPLLEVRTAVSRLTRTGNLVGFREAVELPLALAAVTRDAAWQLGLEDQVGQLAPGWAADMVVLSDDPRQVPPASLHRIRVEATFIAGRQVAGSAVSLEP